MPKIGTYHRPETLAEALNLLAEPGAAALAGGTQLVAAGEAHAVVVDLRTWSGTLLGGRGPTPFATPAPSAAWWPWPIRKASCTRRCWCTTPR